MPHMSNLFPFAFRIMIKVGGGIKVGVDLTGYTFRHQISRYKFRLFMKKSPNLLTLELAPITRLMPYEEQHRQGLRKFNQPTSDVCENFYNNDVTDLLKPNVETNYNQRGRIDARRPEFAIKKWVEANEDWKLWLKHQEGAEFIRNTPMTMVNYYRGTVHYHLVHITSTCTIIILSILLGINV